MPDRRPPKRGRPPSPGGWWPTPSKPIRVEGGLQARSQRGRIGESWWSQRFIAVLESVGVGGRLQRGKHYARIGQVLEMEIFPGKVTARVQGSRAKPYDVSLQTSVLTPGEWDSAEKVMESSAVFLAKLLAGDMPEEIEQAFAGSSGSLFPGSAREFDSECSCPDWENPCKHIAAVLYVFADQLDVDPWLVLRLRGRTRADVLAPFSSTEAPPHADPSTEIAPWWPFAPGALPDLPGADPLSPSLGPDRAGAALDALDTLEVAIGAVNFIELVRPVYESLIPGVAEVE
jgi:uncharacterized Zn finger protein